MNRFHRCQLQDIRFSFDTECPPSIVLPKEQVLATALGRLVKAGFISREKAAELQRRKS